MVSHKGTCANDDFMHSAHNHCVNSWTASVFFSITIIDSIFTSIQSLLQFNLFSMELAFFLHVSKKIVRFSIDREHPFWIYTFDWANFASSFFSNKFMCQLHIWIHAKWLGWMVLFGTREAHTTMNIFFGFVYSFFSLHSKLAIKDSTISIAWTNFYP